MSLSDFACKNAKPKDKPYRLADGDGLPDDGRRIRRLANQLAELLFIGDSGTTVDFWRLGSAPEV